MKLKEAIATEKAILARRKKGKGEEKREKKKRKTRENPRNKSGSANLIQAKPLS